MRHALLAGAVLLTACVTESEPEAVEPSTTSTAGGLLTPEPGPQASLDEDEEALDVRVARALREAPGVDDSAIRVRADGDFVYLAGTVGTPDDLRAAKDIARSVSGVRQVDVEELALR